jgi:hypothetical protein
MDRVSEEGEESETEKQILVRGFYLYGPLIYLDHGKDFGR